MNNKLLLTGVAGFIGAHTLEHFLENTDMHIVGVDSLAHHGDMRRINQVLEKNPSWRARFEFIRADLAYKGQLSGLPNDIRYIINMASESHVDRSIENPAPFIKNNVDLIINMLEYARQTKPECFIQISTDEVYGPMLQEKPYKEWARELPSNPYSASKAAQEMIAISYWRTYGVPVVITNTMNNIGEMQDAEKFLPLIISRILKGKPVPVHGTPKHIGSRFYLHARNHADALLFIITQLGKPTRYSENSSYPDRYNVAGTTRLSNLDLATKVSSILGMPLKYEFVDFHSTRPGHDMHYGLDGTKLEKLGWTAPLDFDVSLERTVANYVSHREWLES